MTDPERPIPIVRQAVYSDLDTLAALFDLYRQFNRREPDLAAARAFLAERFNHGQSIIFVAELDAGPVGFTQLYPSFSSVSLARAYILNDLYVVESARRRGVGAKLLEAATQHARAMGAVRVSLNVEVDNTSAQAMYEALGWTRGLQHHAYHFALAQQGAS